MPEIVVWPLPDEHKEFLIHLGFRCLQLLPAEVAQTLRCDSSRPDWHPRFTALMRCLDCAAPYSVCSCRIQSGLATGFNKNDMAILGLATPGFSDVEIDTVVTTASGDTYDGGD